ncbi:hypothetical protein M405DRAFT_290619 [Rhizopogon salebrosus TDB-379]|nr:hypothetical protein M405DRAFT_290619 [Rhizopogon salebrosus TDB-379]
MPQRSRTPFLVDFLFGHARAKIMQLSLLSETATLFLCPCARVANLWSRGASTRSTSEMWLPTDPVESAEVLRQNTVSKGTRADTRGVVSIAYLELRIHAVATQYSSSIVPVTPRTRG